MAVAAMVYGRVAAVPNATITSTASDPKSWTRTADDAPDRRYRLLTAISSVRLRPTARTKAHTNTMQPATNRARLTPNPSHASEPGAATPATVPTPKTTVPVHEARM